MLLLDSWTTYNDNSTLTKVIPEGTTIDVLRIPKHTTSLVQPCDVFFFRIWKNFIRKFSDRVILDDIDISLHQRDNIFQIQSLIHYQFSAPKFQDFIKYSWVKYDYFDDRPPLFITPVQYCFDLK